MMCAAFNGNSYTKPVSSYSPTNVCEETDISTFCNEFSSLVRHIPNNNVMIISGSIEMMNIWQS